MWSLSRTEIEGLLLDDERRGIATKYIETQNHLVDRVEDLAEHHGVSPAIMNEVLVIVLAVALTESINTRMQLLGLPYPKFCCKHGGKVEDEKQNEKHQFRCPKCVAGLHHKEGQDAEGIG